MKFRWTYALTILGAVLAVSVIIVDLGYRGRHRYPLNPVWTVTDGDHERGRQAIIDYGCTGCHTIPGIRNATGRVGPQLYGFREQVYIAGMLPNAPEHLIAWIENPKAVNPRTAMPNLGVTESDARDIAAYLYDYPQGYRFGGPPLPSDASPTGTPSADDDAAQQR